MNVIKGFVKVNDESGGNVMDGKTNNLKESCKYYTS